MIGPVPLVITIGATGQVGAGLELSAFAQGRAAAADDCTVDTVGNSINAAIRPYVRLKAFADAGIEAIVAKVGVRGDLDLIDASLPVTLSMEFAPGDIDSLRDALLRITGTADLDLMTLDGKLRAYFRIGWCPLCDTTRRTIVSWDGPKTHRNLIEREFDFNLYDLATLL